MKKILACDPGTYCSGVVEIWGDGSVVPIDGEMPNEKFLKLVKETESYTAVVCEWFEAHGNAVGQETFETVFWIGRFAEASKAHFVRIPRRRSKIHHCHNNKASDSNIRMAIIDRYGGQDKAIGKKKTPGPLKDVVSHMWQALAIGLVYLDEQKEEAIADRTQ